MCGTGGYPTRYPANGSRSNASTSNGIVIDGMLIDSLGIDRIGHRPYRYRQLDA